MKKVEVNARAKEAKFRSELMRKVARYVNTIPSTYYNNQICSEDEIQKELNTFKITGNKSIRMALNYLSQSGIFKPARLLCVDESGVQIINKRFFRMKIYARAIRTLRNEYVRTLTPTHYTVKQLESYFS